ncbi:MAG: TPM domain-containing protein [Pirellulaceae bacterium]
MTGWRRIPRALGLLTIVALAVGGWSIAGAQQKNVIDLQRPGPREFIVDRAGLLSSTDRDQILKTSDKLLTDKATPIIVVTIDSMAEHGGAGMRIETFATLLFDQWQIGQAKLGDTTWNTGILLLVSKNDRKARIELGGYWRHDQDALAERIMNEQIVPRFKQGDFSGGIAAGVEALAAMARGLELPQAQATPQPWWMYLVWIGLAGLAIFTVVSLIRRGSSGWAWLLWAAVIGVIGYALYQYFNRSNSGGGGGFSGGSFGGGFSGGGGATGSW